jgi:adenylate cyclase class 2
MYEVEQKFRVDDFTEINQRLDDLGCSTGTTVEQIDRYLRHPSRDFAATDEALRLRRIGEKNFITYKGPKIDTTTKTRREIELPMTAGSDWLENYTGLMGCLGFEVVAEVVKSRCYRMYRHNERPFEICLDDVRDVGRFVELETASDEDQLDAARAALMDLSSTLSLDRVERFSYLGLLLRARGET